MTVYWILLIFLTAGGWYAWEGDSSKGKQRAYLLAAGIFLTALSALRYRIGFDYESYENLFLLIAETGSPMEAFSAAGTELGITVPLMWICSRIGGYRVFLLVCGLWMTGAVIWVLRRYCPRPWLGLFLYVALQIFAHSMNLVRQSMAASVLLLGLGLLKKGRFLPYLGVTAAAALFHPTALAAVPLYFLLRMPFSWKRTAVLSVLGGLLYGFYQPAVELAVRFFPAYGQYLDSVFAQGGNWLYTIFPGILAVLALACSGPLVRRNPENSIFIHAAFLNFWVYLFMTRMFILERFAIYLFPYAMFLLPELVCAAEEAPPVWLEEQKRRTESRYYRNWAAAAVLILGLGYFSFSAANGFHKVYPYVSIFNREDAVSNEKYLGLE